MNLKINKHHWSVWVYRATFGVSESKLPTNLCNFFWKWLLSLLAIPVLAWHLVICWVRDRKNPETHSMGATLGVWTAGLAVLCVCKLFMGGYPLVKDFPVFVGVLYLLPLVGLLVIGVIWGIIEIVAIFQRRAIERNFEIHKQEIFDLFFSHYGEALWNTVLGDVNEKRDCLTRLRYRKKQQKPPKPKSDGIWKIITKKYVSFKENYCPQIEWQDKNK